jgi:hypothetical protein
MAKAKRKKRRAAGSRRTKARKPARTRRVTRGDPNPGAHD